MASDSAVSTHELHTQLKIGSYMMATALSTIPQDILLSILDALGTIHEPDARSALRSCILVSKLFRHFALTRLFYRVTITNEYIEKEKNRDLSRLQRILDPFLRSSLGGIGPYIKEVVLSFKSEPSGYGYSGAMSRRLFWDRSMEMDLDDFFAKPELAMVVNQLHKKDYGIRRLTVDLSATFKGQRWPKFSSALKTALQAIVRSQYLESLDIRGIAQLPPDFLTGSGVTDVRLQAFSDHVDVFYRRYRAEELMTTPSQLQVLYTDSTYRFKLPSRLKVLSAQYGPGDFNHSIDIMQASAGTLEHVTIIYHDDADIFVKMHQTFHVDLMPLLKSFKFHQDATNLRHVPLRRPLRMLHHIFNVLQLMDSLQEIVLRPVFTHVGTDGYAIETDPLWTQLEDLLTSAKYPSLQRVQINIYMHHIDIYQGSEGSELFCSNIAEFVVKSLPRLAESRAVDVSVSLQI